MPINLHQTPTVPCKHPSIAGAFLILALESVQPRLSSALSSTVPQASKEEIQDLAGSEIRTVIQY